MPCKKYQSITYTLIGKIQFGYFNPQSWLWPRCRLSQELADGLICGLIIALEAKLWIDILILKVDLGWGVICGALLFCGGACPLLPHPGHLGQPQTSWYIAGHADPFHSAWYSFMHAVEQFMPIFTGPTTFRLSSWPTECPNPDSKETAITISPSRSEQHMQLKQQQEQTNNHC